MVVEVFNEEKLHYMDALNNAVNTVESLREGLKRHGKSTIVWERSDIPSTEKVSVPFDEELVQAVAAAGFGAYLTLKNEGLHNEANEVLLREGFPQQLSPYQEKKLRNIDKQLK